MYRVLLKLALAGLVLLIALAIGERIAQAKPQVGGRTSPDGTEVISTDLLESQQMRNTGGRDGAGLCVFTSIEHCARYQNVSPLLGLQKWMTQKPGGGYPEKVAALLPQYCQERGLTTPSVLQHTGGDVEFLKLALATGRMPGVTYAGVDGVFYREVIAHMVNLVHFSDKWAAILDNNNPGKYLWMTPTEFSNRWVGRGDNGETLRSGGFAVGGGWAIVLLDSPPPPVPTNALAMMGEEVDVGREKMPVGQVMYGQNCAGGSCLPQSAKATVRSYPSSVSAPIVLASSPASFGQQCACDVCDCWQSGVYRWEKGDKGCYYLYCGKAWIGTLHPDERGFAVCFGNGKWSGTCQPPIAVPATVGQEKQATAKIQYGDDKNFGIDCERLKQSESNYICNGLPCPAAKARNLLIGGDSLTDDRGKPHLTIVGDDTLRKRVLQDLQNAPELSAWRGKLHIQAYSADHWDVQRIGMAPGVTFQAADNGTGKSPVLFRIRSYEGPGQLAEALRDRDPNYKPDSDPDGKAKPKIEPVKPSDPSKPEPNQGDKGALPQLVLLAVLGFLGYKIAKK